MPPASAMPPCCRSPTCTATRTGRPSSTSTTRSRRRTTGPARRWRGIPDRLVAFCSVNPLKDYALEEIARCGRDPRLSAGLKLHFGNSDVNLTDPAARRAGCATSSPWPTAKAWPSSSTPARRSRSSAPTAPAHARAFLSTLLPNRRPTCRSRSRTWRESGGYDEAGVDDAVGVFVDAIAAKDPRMARVWFDVSGIALASANGRVRRRASPSASASSVSSESSGARTAPPAATTPDRGVEGVHQDAADAGRDRDDPHQPCAVLAVANRAVTRGPISPRLERLGGRRWRCWTGLSARR